MHDAEIGAFAELAARLPSFGAEVDANLGRYVLALHARMHGMLD